MVKTRGVAREAYGTLFRPGKPRFATWGLWGISGRLAVRVLTVLQIRL